jgi:hypothetical protein
VKYLLSFLVLLSLLTFGCVASRLNTGYDIKGPSASTTHNIPRAKPASSPPFDGASPTKAVAAQEAYSDALFPDRF